jgi:tRNA(Ile)-lysidine synthase
LGLPWRGGRADRPTRDEAGARAQRHAFLTAVADSCGPHTRIALGHSAEDRVETLLLNLLRGSGLTGLGALAPADGALVRPLLAYRRAELRAWCTEHGLPFCDDPTNHDRRYARNRVRLDVLPAMANVRPGAVAAAARTARVCGEERAALARYGELLLAQRLVTPPAGAFLDGLDALVLDLCDWRELPTGERWLVLRAALRRVRGSLAHVDLGLVERLDALAAGPPDAGVLGGRGGDELRIARWGGRLVFLAGAPGPAWGPVALPARGEVAVPAARLRVVVGPAAAGLPLSTRVRGHLALAVRSRRAGDRLRPVGRGGSRSVKALLGEYDVPSLVRERVPVVVCGEQVVWLPGGPPDEAFVPAAADEGVDLGVVLDVC